MFGKSPKISDKNPRLSEWWFSCSKFTVLVITVNGIIRDGAPIIRKFKGQRLENLARWMAKFGGFKWHKY